MGVQSKLAEVLPQYYSYVVFVAIDSILINWWMAYNVGKARKKFNIKYPIMYDTENNEFNCIQRAHQHTLEMYPGFLATLLIGGLQNPRFAAGAGAVYLLGRIVFAKGYYTGDPEKRRQGGFGMIGLLALLGNTACFAFHQIKFDHPNWCQNC